MEWRLARTRTGRATPRPAAAVDDDVCPRRRADSPLVGRARRSRPHDGKAAATARGGTRHGIRVRRRRAPGTGKGRSGRRRGGIRGGHRRGVPRDGQCETYGRGGRRPCAGGVGRRTRVAACGKPRDAGGSAHRAGLPAVRRAVRGHPDARRGVRRHRDSAVALTGQYCPAVCRAVRGAGSASQRAEVSRCPRQRSRAVLPSRAPGASGRRAPAHGRAARRTTAHRRTVPPDRAHRPTRGDRGCDSPTRAQCGRRRGLCGDRGIRRRTRHIPLPRPR